MTKKKISKINPVNTEEGVFMWLDWRSRANCFVVFIEGEYGGGGKEGSLIQSKRGSQGKKRHLF